MIKVWQKCVSGVLCKKILWHALDRSAVLLRIRFDGGGLRKKVSTRHVNLGTLCLVATSNVVKFSQRLCCNHLLHSKFLVILLLSL